MVSPDDNMGCAEAAIMEEFKELQAKILERFAQAKADRIPLVCPICQRKLVKRKRLTCTIKTRFGPIQVSRVKGYCPSCKKWFLPADAALGIEGSGYSPGVQEAVALTVSRVPVKEAVRLLDRLAGIKMPLATADREAKRQGRKARVLRSAQDAKMVTVAAAEQYVAPIAALADPLLIIQIDAFHIRERDDWGLAESLRRKGKEPLHWHWTYTGVCYRSQQRIDRGDGRPFILSKGYVATRCSADFPKQLKAEALRQGLIQAKEALVIADGAVWIWSLANDAFPQAHQRLDAYHAKQHLWAVAETIYGKHSEEGRKWLAPLLKQLDRGKPLLVIASLEKLLGWLEPEPQRAVVKREMNYYTSHAHRMDYGRAKRRKEPCGSGTIESACKQYQCRFKRCGQFWSTEGDESLMCLETFWRNDRWNLLYPHSAFKPSGI